MSYHFFFLTLLFGSSDNTIFIVAFLSASDSFLRQEWLNSLTLFSFCSSDPFLTPAFSEVKKGTPSHSVLSGGAVRRLRMKAMPQFYCCPPAPGSWALVAERACLSPESLLIRAPITEGFASTIVSGTWPGPGSPACDLSLTPPLWGCGSPWCWTQMLGCSHFAPPPPHRDHTWPCPCSCHRSAPGTTIVEWLRGKWFMEVKDKNKQTNKTLI